MREFLDTHGEGIHHVAFDCDHAPWDQRVANFAARGFASTQSGRCVDQNSFPFFDTEGATTTCLETYHFPEGFAFPGPTAPTAVVPSPPPFWDRFIFAFRSAAPGAVPWQVTLASPHSSPAGRCHAALPEQWLAGRLVVADHALQRVRAAPLLSRSGRHGRAMAPDERARTTALSRAHATSPHGDRLPPGRFSRATRVSAPAGWLNCSSPEPLRHRRNFRHLRAPRHRSAPGSGRGACNDKPPANAYAPEWGTGSQVRYAL
jgi:hypothetical protein